MLLVVPPAVAQVDATDERHIAIRSTGMTKDDELLVVRTERAHAHVEQALPPGRLDLGSELTVLGRAELEAIEVRAPYEAAHIDTATGSRSEHRADLGAPLVQALVRIPSPVGEQEQVARPIAVTARWSSAK